MDLKEKVELLNKQIDSLDKETNVIYRKLFVLITAGAGSGSALFQVKEILVFNIIFFVFSLIAFAISLNYWRLGLLRDKINKINLEIERILSE